MAGWQAARHSTTAPAPVPFPQLLQVQGRAVAGGCRAAPAGLAPPPRARPCAVRRPLSHRQLPALGAARDVGLVARARVHVEQAGDAVAAGGRAGVWWGGVMGSRRGEHGSEGLQRGANIRSAAAGLGHPSRGAAAGCLAPALCPRGLTPSSSQSRSARSRRPRCSCAETPASPPASGPAGGARGGRGQGRARADARQSAGWLLAGGAAAAAAAKQSSDTSANPRARCARPPRACARARHTPSTHQASEEEGEGVHEVVGGDVGDAQVGALQ